MEKEKQAEFQQYLEVEVQEEEAAVQRYTSEIKKLESRYTSQKDFFLFLRREEAHWWKDTIILSKPYRLAIILNNL